ARLVHIAIAGERELALFRLLPLEDNAANARRILARHDAIEDDIGNGELADHAFAARFEIDALGEAAAFLFEVLEIDLYARLADGDGAVDERRVRLTEDRGNDDRRVALLHARKNDALAVDLRRFRLRHLRFGRSRQRRFRGCE